MSFFRKKNTFFLIFGRVDLPKPHLIMGWVGIFQTRHQFGSASPSPFDGGPLWDGSGRPGLILIPNFPLIHVSCSPTPHQEKQTIIASMRDMKPRHTWQQHTRRFFLSAHLVFCVNL